MIYPNSLKIISCIFKLHNSCGCHNSYYFLKPTAVNVISKLFIHREINENVQSKLRSQDKIPDSYRIIYRAPLKTYIKLTYYAAFSSIVVMTPLLATSMYLSDFSNFPIMFSNMEFIHNFNEFCGFVGGLLFVTVQVGIVVFKYPLRIYKDNCSKRYIAIYQHILPWMHEKEEFSAGELQKSKKGIMPWKESLYIFRNRKAIILENYFTRPADFNEMLQTEKKVAKV